MIQEGGVVGKNPTRFIGSLWLVAWHLGDFVGDWTAPVVVPIWHFILHVMILILLG